ncbi:hypothetical protein N781_02955 [Pontibacillus halophilus JSM 076056 = DSM 19796]|uniref:YxiS n=1 Tax=Pontibacillus halophilus JSM 076056 = DSM 19796 TaxID=1385510 RepID=A0A0A5GFL8_9BACI|nr:hypothetical protein [Pontibacillus halophilus]KGX92001.1 hypothetical protein N781_02955 [Pontibacillus halophilus JSM 076056 = DSM 19796]
MNSKDIEDKIVENYRQDENMMILVFAQWCVNQDLDPVALYKQAYPDQGENTSLQQGVALTVSKQESEHIPDQTLLGVLSLFGNDDLAFVVNEVIQNRKN